MLSRGTGRVSDTQAVRGSCEACSMYFFGGSEYFGMLNNDAGLRKVKCPGEHPICSKCHASKRECHYSLQKPMGRPRSARQPNRQRRLIQSEQTPQSPSPANVSEISTTAALDAGTEISQTCTSDLSSDEALASERGQEEDGFEIHQCLLNLGQPR